MRATHYTLRLSSAALLIGVLSGCAARLPPLTNYSLPNTKKVTFATCYYHVGLFSTTKQPKDYFTKYIQTQDAYVVANTKKVLEKAGYQVYPMGCNGAFKADEKSIRIALVFFVFPSIPENSVLANVFVVPPYTQRQNIPAIVQLKYGNIFSSATEVFPEVPPILLQKIAEGQRNSVKTQKGQGAKATHSTRVGNGS